MSEQDESPRAAEPSDHTAGNLDSRGVSPVEGEPQVDPSGEVDSLDDDLDTSLRTDGRGGSPDVGQPGADQPDQG
ncbi:hypothetical protein [Angustibacter luteus]|uniref:Sugar ABC transporter ATPase n=1 Tax=Angustibacter luteus TaxID=658456 RepID=A0ABW1JGX0_9ACTN